MSDTKINMQLQCPMPKMDTDVITLGHGSGGLLTNKLLNAGVFNVLQNQLLDQHHDGVTLKLDGATAFTTDSFVISPIFFPGGNIGELAINGTVNDLAMCGAIPKYLSLSFIIEEGMAMESFWGVLNGIKAACDLANVMIVTGDTKVVEKGKGDQIFINTTGIGTIHPKANIKLDRIKPGDAIIVSHQIATHGMAIMSVREGLAFETKIESDTCPLNHIFASALDEFGSSIHLLRDPTRGGLGTVLNEIAREGKVGIDIDQRSIPIDSQVASACEILGLDPLYVANEGVFIAIVESQIADKMVQHLHQFEPSRAAAIIGHVGAQHPKQVVLKSPIGGKRVVNMLVGEQLPRIC